MERLTLDQCIERALEQNHQRPASRFAVAAAEAQHRQALSGYWPQLSFKGGFQRMDEAPNFIFPASAMYIPAQTIGVPWWRCLRDNSGDERSRLLPPSDVQMPVSYPGQSIGASARQFPIPEQELSQLMDERDSIGHPP